MAGQKEVDMLRRVPFGLLLIVLATLALFLVNFRVRAETSDITISLGKLRPVAPHIFGYNIGSTIRGVARDDPTYNAALAALQPGTIRFPGGTVANYWDWERADFVCDAGGNYQLVSGEVLACELPSGYHHLDPPRHTLEAFKTELERTDAEAVFVLNMLTQHVEQERSALEHALAMLRHAKALGIAVRYIELGNELYLPHGDHATHKDYAAAYPNAEAYAREASRWLVALREAFPEAQVAVVGADKRANAGDRRNSWSTRVLAALTAQPDALTLHPTRARARQTRLQTC